MPLIDVEQAVEAVLALWASLEHGDLVSRERVVTALRAIRPQEPSEAEVERVAIAIRGEVHSERATALDDETDCGWTRNGESCLFLPATLY